MTQQINDIDQIGQIDETATFELRHPITDAVINCDNGDPMTITVMGRDADQYRSFERKVQNKALAQAQKKRNATITAETIEERSDALLALCVKSWTIVLKGKTPETDSASVLEVMANYPWIKEQIDEHVHDRANFMKS